MSTSPPTTIFRRLSQAFNDGRTRAVLCGGQAVVLHRLAVMSKDGDWILREDDECLGHVLRTLQRFGAAYRFGAPLHLNWLSHGWSSHFEFPCDGLRVRTDFFTRPPRLDAERLEKLWQNASGDVPFTDAECLADLKKTNREKDYVVIGDLARLLNDPTAQLIHSRSARDILDLAKRFPVALSAAADRRPILRNVATMDEDELAAVLDAERRRLIKDNETRLAAYVEAARPWRDAWPETERDVRGMSLLDAHDVICEKARRLLPTSVMPRSDS